MANIRITNIPGKNASSNKNKTLLLAALKARLIELSHLYYSIALLSWDTQVNMPRKANEQKSQTIAHLTAMNHKKFLEIDNDKTLSRLKEICGNGVLSNSEQVIVNETWKSYERASKLPAEFVKKLSEVTSRSNIIWAEARAKSDFKLFAPILREIVELKREEAAYLGFKKSAYDPIIDPFEPGMTSDEMSIIFEELKEFLVPFIAKINKSGQKINPKAIHGNFPISKQIELNNLILKKMGFDFEAGRLDTSAHPFTSGCHPFDVRITTRYDKKDIFASIGSTVHEFGHALYEQGLAPEHYGTPLGESISTGIHESQSRIMENMIGQSMDFCRFLHPILKTDFPKPFQNISTEELYRVINVVQRSLIRVESDEVTYNLHIILRFEIEKELIEGSIAVEDLPKIWNDKMRTYFGIKAPNDRLGVLQDVHWADGYFGYFPTYALGNLYSAQFYSAARRDIVDLDKQIRTGNFRNFIEWLRKNIHQHGKFYTASSLIKQATGAPLQSSHYLDYLQNKYSKIYGL